MADLTDSNVRSIVRDELRDVANTLKHLEHSLSSLEAKLHDFQRLMHDVQALDHNLKDMHARIKHGEEMSQYTAGYVAMRLKEKYDRETY